ncbi:hypothetical protein [Paenibacillus sp. FJAT-27812]|uniref:hypothetical protein n=1 Tax=Paenibacillus sp. FJAT-27812 TaxID=1684143 RepID=UPI0006A785E4|nr:hypothetical protein [Paenibacillus sp. FJAT-27812]
MSMKELLGHWNITEGTLDASPEDVELDSRQLSKLDSHFQNLIAHQQIQAAGFLAQTIFDHEGVH